MRIVITGTTSGIGASLALHYAREGVTLGLIGRRQERLEEMAERCAAEGALTLPAAIDVCDAEIMQEYARQFVQEAGGVDLVIANAGIGAPDDLPSGDAAAHAHLFEVNVLGVLHTLLPFIPTMVQQRQGQLVAISSIAGFRVLPGSTTYAATKIAVRALMEGYGWELRRHGIMTTTINPGFVVSEMTDRHPFRLPFLLQTDDAVRRIIRAIAQKRRNYTFPWPMAIIGHLLPYFPGWILGRLRPPGQLELP